MNTRKRKAAESLASSDVMKFKDNSYTKTNEEPLTISLPNKSLLSNSNDLDSSLEEFPDGTKDLLLQKSRQYHVQEWKQSEELYEFLQVYLFCLLEKGELFISHYSKNNSNVFKCGEKNCPAQLKIEVEDVKEEEEKKEDRSHSFTSNVLKKAFDLKIPKLTVFRSNQHKNHGDNYPKMIEKKIKGNIYIYIYFLKSFLETGIHPLLKLIIEKNELYYLRPKQILSKMREKDEIDDKYLPNKLQIASFISNFRKTLIQKYLKNNSEALNEYIDKNSWDKVNNENDIICLESDLSSENFLLIFSSKTLMKNVINQNNVTGKTFIHLDATYKLLSNGFSLLTVGTEDPSHKFKLIACAISAHENTFAYERFIKTLKQTFLKQYNYELNLNFVVSDAADCIHSAVTKLFPNTVHIRCFFTF